MVTFVDTSALVAFLDADDPSHPTAVRALRSLIDSGEPLLTHNYVAVESIALVQRRLGLAATGVLCDELLPLIEHVWVDETLHRRAVDATRAADRRGVSVVDRTSFAVMRDRSIGAVWAYDDDFDREGFATLR
jgi:uncharacterized protein